MGVGEGVAHERQLEDEEGEGGQTLDHLTKVEGGVETPRLGPVRDHVRRRVDDRVDGEQHEDAEVPVEEDRHHAARRA